MANSLGIIAIAGGIDVVQAVRHRIVAPEAVIAAAPDVILAS